MRTLHFGLRVADQERSVAFYRGIGYEVVGSVTDTPFGELTMLKLPGDESVSIELVHDDTAGAVGSGLNHFVIKVESMGETVGALTAQGIAVEQPVSPDGTSDVRTAWTTDPDGNRIELVQWPPGHPDGMTRGDFSG